MNVQKNIKNIYFPLADKNEILSLKAGEFLHISGTVYTARDGAHRRLMELIENNEPMPFDFENNIVYYAGPSPTRENATIGSIGPTTGSRMDAYTPTLMERSLIYMIGKGKRNSDVTEAIKKHKGIYFATIGGAGAYIAQCVKSICLVAFEDLGAEAIYKISVENMPVIVATDCNGQSSYLP